MEFDWVNLLQVLGGVIIGGGGVFGIKAAMRKGKADAELAEHDADKAEVERLHLQIDHQQKTLETYSKMDLQNASETYLFSMVNTVILLLESRNPRILKTNAI